VALVLSLFLALGIEALSFCALILRKRFKRKARPFLKFRAWLTRGSGERQYAISERQYAISERQHSISERQHSISERQHSISERPSSY